MGPPNSERENDVICFGDTIRCLNQGDNREGTIALSEFGGPDHPFQRVPKSLYLSGISVKVFCFDFRRRRTTHLLSFQRKKKKISRKCLRGIEIFAFPYAED